MSPFFSIIVPVYNGAATLDRCLASIVRSDFTDWELIVVDDGSEDNSAEIGQKYTTHILHTPTQSGPAAARNLAAKHARGHYLFFTDADCELQLRTLSEIASVFRKNANFQQSPTAIIGSYDDAPSAVNFASQYKNLLHHFTHQTASENAQTFWTGCGAIDHSSFLQLGGFDANRYPQPSIEDIELGYRLAAAGGTIRLLKTAQVKHLKHWSLWSMLRSDIFDRALPWSILLLERPIQHRDLNISPNQRLSVVLAFLLLPLGLLQRRYGLLTACVIVLLNWRWYYFLIRKRSLQFTLCAMLLQWVGFVYSGLAFCVAWLQRIAM